MKFGDIIENEWAGAGNPTKKLMIICHRGKYSNLVAGNGEILEIYKYDVIKSEKFKKVGEIDLSEIKNFYNETKKQFESEIK